MNRISVLIPDADVRLRVACCLAASGRAVVHGFACRPAPEARRSRFFASFEEYQGAFDPQVWLARIGGIVAERRIDVVLPTADFAIRTLSQYRPTLDWAEKLPLLPEPDVYDTATDKAKLAGVLARCGLPHPPTVVVSAGAPPAGDLSALAFPVLAKPPRSTGGIGIRCFGTREALSAFLAGRPRDECWVVQSQIEGHDLGVNVLCRDGRILAACAQHTIAPSPQPFRTPVGIAVRDDPQAMALVERLVAELGWSGVANVDLRYDARRKLPLVLELNGRYWYTLQGSLYAGMNFPLLACETCLGQSNAGRRPHNARYFAGRAPALLSLVGGGRFRIRPHETNLKYFDPLPIAVSVAEAAASRARTVFAKGAAKLGSRPPRRLQKT